MDDSSRSPAEAIAGSLVGRLRHPWLFALLAALLVADLLVPDPIPFIDEMVLALLTALAGFWRTRGKAVGARAPVADKRRTPPELRG
jgi:hypothetical protein